MVLLVGDILLVVVLGIFLPGNPGQMLEDNGGGGDGASVPGKNGPHGALTGGGGGWIIWSPEFS